MVESEQSFILTCPWVKSHSSSCVDVFDCRAISLFAHDSLIIIKNHKLFRIFIASVFLLTLDRSWIPSSYLKAFSQRSETRCPWAAQAEYHKVLQQQALPPGAILSALSADPLLSATPLLCYSPNSPDLILIRSYHNHILSLESLQISAVRPGLVRWSSEAGLRPTVRPGRLIQKRSAKPLRAWRSRKWQE